jgi:hypothetical protein
MYWLRTKFKAWAKSQGVHLIHDDLVFIEKILHKLPQNLHRTLVRDFVYKWIEGMDQDENSSQNQNKGRYKANFWLRNQLE